MRPRFRELATNSHRERLRSASCACGEPLKSPGVLAQALGVPMYALFYEDDELPALRSLRSAATGWGNSRRDARILDRFRRLMSRMDEGDQKLRLHMAQKMASK